MLFRPWTGRETLQIGPSIKIQNESVQKLVELRLLHIRRKMPVSPPSGQNRMGFQAPKAFELTLLKPITVFHVFKVIFIWFRRLPLFQEITDAEAMRELLGERYDASSSLNSQSRPFFNGKPRFNSIWVHWLLTSLNDLIFFVQF